MVRLVTGSFPVLLQEALAELKGAVRAAGEHKQRIAVTVAMDGIRLRDDRTGVLYYHYWTGQWYCITIAGLVYKGTCCSHVYLMLLLICHD